MREKIDRIKNFKYFINENVDLENKLKNHLIDGKYLYHYTKTEYLEYIKEEGLVPRKYPNSNYSNGAKGVFLTVNDSLYKANLPESLIEQIEEYYDNGEIGEKPIVRLTIDISKLDINKFIWDDDYILNRYGWNKAETNIDKIIESLDIWGSIAYLGTIPPNLIVNSDFEYSN
jgi:hypothetical protein